MALPARRLTGWLHRAPCSPSLGAFGHLSAPAGSLRLLARPSALNPPRSFVAGLAGKTIRVLGAGSSHGHVRLDLFTSPALRRRLASDPAAPSARPRCCVFGSLKVRRGSRGARQAGTRSGPATCASPRLSQADLPAPPPSPPLPDRPEPAWRRDASPKL